MERYINPIELKQSIAINNILKKNKTIEELIDDEPDADVVEIKHASIVQTLVDGVYKRNCSNCNCDITRLTSWFSPRYCLMCGAKFDSKQNEYLLKTS